MRAAISMSMLIAGAAWLCGISLVAQRSDAFTGSRDHPAIRYSTGPVENAITRLTRDLDAGKVRLTHDTNSGYLMSLLSALSLPTETSFPPKARLPKAWLCRSAIPKIAASGAAVVRTTARGGSGKAKPDSPSALTALTA